MIGEDDGQVACDERCSVRWDIGNCMDTIIVT